MIQLLWSGEYQIFVLLIIALVLSLTFHESWVMRWWLKGSAMTPLSEQVA